MATFDDPLDSLFGHPRGVSGFMAPSRTYDDEDPLVSSMGGDVTNIMQGDSAPFVNMMMNPAATMAMTTMQMPVINLETGNSLTPYVQVRGEAKKESEIDTIGSPVTGESDPVIGDEGTDRSYMSDEGETSVKKEEVEEDVSSTSKTDEQSDAKRSGGRAVKRGGGVVKRTSMSPMRRDTHNSHTKKCRLKVNTKFQQLVEALPKPPPDVEVKHKAQILDYAIEMFKQVNYERARLQAELHLSTSSNLNRWITDTVKKAGSLRDALTPFFDLMCTEGGWKFAEAWYPVRKGRTRTLASPLSFGFGHIPKIMSPDDEANRPRMQEFLEESKIYCFEPRKGVPGRVSIAMRPEWLDHLADTTTFLRASLATRQQVSTCLGVPIMSSGYCAAVIVLFDTRKRRCDLGFMNRVHDIANCIGNAYGAYKGVR